MLDPLIAQVWADKLIASGIEARVCSTQVNNSKTKELDYLHILALLNHIFEFTSNTNDYKGVSRLIAEAAEDMFDTIYTTYEREYEYQDVCYLVSNATADVLTEQGYEGIYKLPANSLKAIPDKIDMEYLVPVI